MPKNVDRRVKYTLALLKDALVELMQDNHISKISVKQLCEAADVHRSTFYAHFKTPYDLLLYIEQDLFEDLGKYLAEQEYDEAFPISVQKLNRILEHVKQDDRLLRALLSENSDRAIQRDLMESLGVIVPTAHRVADEKTTEYISLFSIHGCVSVISKWLEDGMVEPVEQISEFLFQALEKGIRNLA